MTAEGEHIPVRVESLDIGYIDGMLCAHTLRLRMHLLYMCPLLRLHRFKHRHKPCHFLLRRRLLPLIIEHTIDERSPLIGHTFDSLMAVNSRARPAHCSHVLTPCK